MRKSDTWSWNLQDSVITYTLSPYNHRWLMCLLESLALLACVMQRWIFTEINNRINTSVGKIWLRHFFLLLFQTCYYDLPTTLTVWSNKWQCIIVAHRCQRRIEFWKLPQNKIYSRQLQKKLFVRGLINFVRGYREYGGPHMSISASS